MHLRELDANLIVVLDALLIDASVTRAAERLGRSPSAVSHALSNLREVFGDELFVRAGQRLVATAKARQLAPAVHVIVAGMESLLRPAAPFDPGTQKRSFALACRETYELTLLQGLRRSLAETAPGISVGWQPLQGDVSLEELRQGRLHFLIREGLDEQAADFCWQRLIGDRLTTLAGPKHPLLARAPTLDEFAAAAHVRIGPPDGGRDPVDALLAGKGLERRTVADASSLFVGVFLALDTDALVTVPGSVARAIVQRTAMRPLVQPFKPLEISVYMAWHRSFDRDECHEWMRQRIGEVAAG